MEKALHSKDVMKLLEELRASVPKAECWSCDCLQGFITQLEFDSADNVSELTNPLKVSRVEMHSCLGCEPCPPAEVHVGYIRREKEAGS
jgi:hypothetical protein